MSAGKSLVELSAWVMTKINENDSTQNAKTEWKEITASSNVQTLERKVLHSPNVIDGRWHPQGGNKKDLNAALFPHCVPKECAITVPVEIENGVVTCDNKGSFNDGIFLGHVGSTCQITCDDGYALDYSDDATSWDKQKPLDNKIECLFSQKYYQINGGMYFDVISWSGSTKFECVSNKGRAVERLAAPSQMGCSNSVENGQLFCQGQPYLGPIVPMEQECEVLCFDGFKIEQSEVTCTGDDSPRWSSGTNCH